MTRLALVALGNRQIVGADLDAHGPLAMSMPVQLASAVSR
jgi:hypothetical protein